MAFRTTPVLRVLLWLSVVVAGLGLLAGWRVVSLSESDVIERWSARYVEEARASGDSDASILDCVAVPVEDDGAPGWIAIRCGRDGASVTYRVDRLGRLVGQYAGEGGV